MLYAVWSNIIWVKAGILQYITSIIRKANSTEKIIIKSITNIIIIPNSKNSIPLLSQIFMYGTLMSAIFSWLKWGPFQWHFQFGERQKITRSHVGRVGGLTNQGNVVFSQKNLNQMRRMGGCIVVMELPSFCCPQVRSFAPHSITKATKYPLVVLFGDGLALWCVFVMHHPTGIEKNGQQNLDVAADLPCFLWPRGWWMFPLWGLRLCFWVLPVNTQLITSDLRCSGSWNSTQSSISCAISRRRCFCSIVSSFSTNFTDILLKPKSAVKMVCTNPMLTPTSPASSRTVIRRSCMTKVRTWLMTLSFRLVEGLPWRGPLSTDVLPSLKRLYHSFIRVILMASSTKACWIFRILSTWVSPSFWQNFMQYRCSSCSVILQQLTIQWAFPTLTQSSTDYRLLTLSIGGKKFTHAHKCPLHIYNDGHFPCLICLCGKN